MPVARVTKINRRYGWLLDIAWNVLGITCVKTSHDWHDSTERHCSEVRARSLQYPATAYRSYCYAWSGFSLIWCQSASSCLRIGAGPGFCGTWGTCIWVNSHLLHFAIGKVMAGLPSRTRRGVDWTEHCFLWIPELIETVEHCIVLNVECYLYGSMPSTWSTGDLIANKLHLHRN